ncbi:MAG: M14 family zinc carboxypeptidase [Eubacteriales bacterium]|jgi:g-D-glutamyl-meso-diaminopimelate peptidase
MNSSGSGIDKDKRILDYERAICPEELREYLDILTERYSIKVTSIGLTVLGRSIPMISLGSGKKEILYIGCIHGCDYITASMLLRFINEYCELRKNNRRIYNLSLSSLEQTRTLHIIPMLNLDGVSYTVKGIGEDNPLAARLLAMNGSEDFSRWRANARGVDLERNFGVGYAEYKKCSSNRDGGAPRDYAGLHPESEPESSALCGYIKYNDKTRLVLNFRCGADCVSYIGGSQIPRNRSIAQSLSRISSKPLCEAPADKVMGSLAGWCSLVMNVPAYNIFCGADDNGTDWFLKYAGIRELLFTAPLLV